MDGILQREMLQFLHLRRIVEEDHAVTHQDTHERDKAQDTGHGELHTLDHQTDGHTKHAEREADHDQHSLADILEMPQQHEEDDHHRHHEGTGNLGTGLVVSLILSTVLYLHALGQLEVGQTLHDLLGHDTIVLSTGHFGHHRDGAQTIAVADLTILPGGNNLGKLAQGDAGHETAAISHTLQLIEISGEGSRDTDRNQLVHHILLRSLVGILGLQFHVHVIVTFPRRADGETLTIAERHLQFHILIGDTQSAGLLVIDLDAGGGQGLQHVTAHEHQFRHLAQDLHNAVGIGFQFTEVVALQAHLDGHGTTAETQLLDLHIRLREHLTVFLRTLIDQLHSSLIARGIHDKLRITLIRKLRGVRGMEAGRRTTLEGGDTHHALVLADHVFQRVGHGCGTLDGGTEGQVDLHGKLVTVGDRHHLLRDLEEHHTTDDETACTYRDGRPRMTEAPRQQDLVILVHHVKQVEGLLAVLRLGSLDGFLDEEVLQDGQQRLRNDHRDEEHDTDRPGEGEQEVVELTCHHDQEGEEGHRDTECRGEDRLQEVDGGIDTGLQARFALSHHLHIGVDDHDRVVHNHS